MKTNDAKQQTWTGLGAGTSACMDTALRELYCQDTFAVCSSLETVHVFLHTLMHRNQPLECAARCATLSISFKKVQARTSKDGTTQIALRAHVQESLDASACKASKAALHTVLQGPSSCEPSGSDALMAVNKCSLGVRIRCPDH